MRNRRPFLILLLLFVLPACQVNKDRAPATATKQATAQVFTPVPVETVTAPEAASQLATADSDPESSPTSLPDGPVALPAPSLFQTSWDDWELFRSGLIAEQQDVLDAMAGASVYHLVLNIDEPATVSGQMEVRYTNQEGVPLETVAFHLFPDQLGGSIVINDVTLNGQTVQTDRRETSLQVLLDSPIDVGEQVVFGIDFETTVPDEAGSKYNVLGHDEEILALAHFYPMIAVYDDDGWHIEPSPPHGDETYADMSFFLVEVNAPAAQSVVTSGVEIERVEMDGIQSITIAAGPMRDFYLAMSDRYDVVTDHVGAVQINSYAPRELLDGASLALESASHALRSYNERYGPYPYSELDIVSTPTLALGIEYPGIFANAIRIYDLSQNYASGLPNAVMVESVTAHETAHQWFYNLVGNDQLNEPWLDESVTQYATWMYYVDRYGARAAQGYYDSLEGRWAGNEFADIPIGLPAEAYSSEDYSAIVYGRGPVFLNELAQEMGQETFDAFLRDYSKSLRWEIATTEDFLALAEAHCDCDLAALFEEAVYAR